MSEVAKMGGVSFIDTVGDLAAIAAADMEDPRASPGP